MCGKNKNKNQPKKKKKEKKFYYHKQIWQRCQVPGAKQKQKLVFFSGTSIETIGVVGHMCVSKSKLYISLQREIQHAQE